MSLTTEETALLVLYKAAREKILKGTWSKSRDRAGIESNFNEPPSLYYLERKIAEFESKDAGTESNGYRRVQTTTASNSW